MPERFRHNYRIMAKWERAKMKYLYYPEKRLLFCFWKGYVMKNGVEFACESFAAAREFIEREESRDREAAAHPSRIVTYPVSASALTEVQ